MKIRICSDSTCDLSADLVQKYNIGIRPLYVEMDGKHYRDGVDIKPQDIYDYVSSGKGVCHTAACNIEDYTQFFAENIESYDALIYFNISGEMSSCHQNARLAAEEFENVYVIDSRNLSTGMGLLVLEAAERAAEGISAEQIAAEMQELTAKAEASFVLDTLFYLQKGGRCSALVAMGANLLKLKPCIEVKDGAMGVGKKYRGKTEVCFEQYVKERLEGRADIRKHRVFVTHSGSQPEVVEHIKELVAGYGFEEVLVTTAGCTVSNHCGPNTLGVLFLRK